MEVEGLYKKLPLADLQDYVPSYRTLLFNANLREEWSSARLILDSGQEVSISRWVSKPNLYTSWLLSDFMPLASSLDVPYMLIHGDTDVITRFEPSPIELSMMREFGLNIFMYEPLFFCDLQGNWPWRANSGAFQIPELQWIEQFRQKLGPAPVHIYLCNFGLAEYLRDLNLFPQFNFKYFNSHLLHVHHLNCNTQWTYKPLSLCSKRLVSLNFRYEPARELLVGFLQKHSSQCHISFFHEHDRYYLFKRIPFDPRLLKQWPEIENGITQMQTALPLVLDVKYPLKRNPQRESMPDRDGRHNLKDYEGIRYFIADAFLSLICESRPFDPRGEISEKTLAAIYQRRPFVILGAPYLLEGLHHHGFKTFGDLWDESYDREEEPRLRMQKVLNLVEEILCYTPEKIAELATLLEEICLHNFYILQRHFRSRHIAELK